MPESRGGIKAAYDSHPRVRLAFKGPSRTKQSFAAECDVNNIMKRYEKTGIIEHVNRYQGSYGDFVGVGSYQECLNQVLSAQAMFMSLPASLRSRFGNSPAAFLAFATDEANLEEMRRMGLVPAEEPQQEQGSGEPAGSPGKATEDAPAAS